MAKKFAKIIIGLLTLGVRNVSVNNSSIMILDSKALMMYLNGVLL